MTVFGGSPLKILFHLKDFIPHLLLRELKKGRKAYCPTALPKIRRAVGLFSAHGPSFPYDTSAVGGAPGPIIKVKVISTSRAHHLNPS
jgi:hypothetical protein